MKQYKYAIIGGGVAAGFAIQRLVENEPDSGTIALFSAERSLPYNRPPLSKGFLAGETPAAETLINEPEFYAAHAIDVYLNTRVTNVDLAAHQLTTDDGVYGFEKLLIATGSKVRRFDNVPGINLAGIHYLRRLPDARQIYTMMADAERAVVIGGGFIGMEVASALAQADIETTLAFPEERIMAALFTEQMSDFFTTYYENRGVTIHPNAGVAGFTGDESGYVQAVELTDGTVLSADFVVAGIGVKPNVTLFRDTPLELDNGVVVDRFLETNVPGVLAAGDVAAYQDVIFGKQRRVEHWDNAKQQGMHAADVMSGERHAFEHVPYFFSDVFDLSYEFWGDPTEADTVVHRGDVAGGAFSVWWLRDKELVAAFVMDRPDAEREVAAEWIAAGKKLNPERLRNGALPIHAAQSVDQAIARPVPAFTGEAD